MKKLLLCSMLGFAFSVAANASETLNNNQTITLDESTSFSFKYFASEGRYQKAYIGSELYYIPHSDSESGSIVAGFMDEPWLGLVEYNNQLCVANYKGVRFCNADAKYTVTN
ncbi:hypothetical protein [uncultured Vibrio sp.]|uniref:hypothetical protein n=1 Tax=uncultured Vibrio sp. TaxID=114054 RepID=UPI0025F9AB73|nr:hypothetical protein [uncultured Vibrio sp.]